MSLLIQNGTLILPQGPRRADLLVERGKIAAIGEGLQGDETLRADGQLVFPGFIDPHTHFEMNKGAPNETADDFSSGTAAALAGGTTTILDFATQDRGDTLLHALETWHSRADGHCSCHYGFHMAITDWNETAREQLSAMTAAGVTSYKLYLAYDNLRLSDAAAYEVVRAAAAQGALVSAHCENGDLVNEGIAREKAAGHLTPAAHPVSRPDCVEAEAVSRWLTIGELCGVPVYVVHLSTARGLALIRAARARGQRVFVETCPQYLLLNSKQYLLPGFESAQFVCSPPLRAQESCDALTGALVRGEIDVVSTDHCSFTMDTKALGADDFSAIPNGLPGVEHRPVLLYTLLRKMGRFDPVLMKDLLSSRPARLFGMPQKGELLPGRDADVVLWDPAARWTITAAAQLQRSGYTPFEGTPVECMARTVLLDGRVAARDGQVVCPNLGRYVPRQPVLG